MIQMIYFDNVCEAVKFATSFLYLLLTIPLTFVCCLHFILINKTIYTFIYHLVCLLFQFTWPKCSNLSQSGIRPDRYPSIHTSLNNISSYTTWPIASKPYRSNHFVIPFIAVQKIKYVKLRSIQDSQWSIKLQWAGIGRKFLYHHISFINENIKFASTINKKIFFSSFK